MQARSVTSAVWVAAIFLLAVVSSIGPRYVEWEWWTLVNILSTMALVVTAVLEVARRIWAAVQ